MKTISGIALAAFLTACGSHTYTLSSHSGWSGVTTPNTVVFNGGGPGFNMPPAVVPTPVVTPTPIIPPEVKPPVVTPPVVVPPVVPSNDHHHQHEHYHDKQHHQHDKEHEHHDSNKH